MTRHPNQQTVLNILNEFDRPISVGWLKDHYNEHLADQGIEVRAIELTSMLCTMADGGLVTETVRPDTVSLWQPAERNE